MEIGLKPGIMYNLQKEKQASEITTHPHFEVLCLVSHHSQMYAAASNFRSRLNNLKTLAICVKWGEKREDCLFICFFCFQLIAGAVWLTSASNMWLCANRSVILFQLFSIFGLYLWCVWRKKRCIYTSEYRYAYLTSACASCSPSISLLNLRRGRKIVWCFFVRLQ